MGCDAKPYKPEGFTKWDKLLIREGDITLQQLLDLLKARYGINVSFIESLKATQAGIAKAVYAGMGKTDTKVSEILQRKFPKLNLVTPATSFTVMAVSATNDAGDSLLVPQLVFYWK